jgi:ankyrin repeat protein
MCIVTHQNQKGITPLSAAIAGKQMEVIRYLVEERGANVNHRSRVSLFFLFLLFVVHDCNTHTSLTILARNEPHGLCHARCK